MVMDHHPQIRDTHTVQVLDILLTVNLPHPVLIPLLHLKVIHHLLLDPVELHKVIHTDNMALLAATIHHHLHNTIKAMVHLVVVMVSIDLHLIQVTKYLLIQDLDHLQVGPQLQASILATIKVEDIHHTRKEDLYLQVLVLRVLLLHHNDK